MVQCLDKRRKWGAFETKMKITTTNFTNYSNYLWYAKTRRRKGECLMQANSEDP